MVDGAAVEAGRCGVRKPLHERAVRQQVSAAVVAGVSRRTEPEPRGAHVHRTLSHRHRHGAQAVSALAAQRARPADERVRARPRDHVEGARARMPHRRGADSVFSAEPRRRERRSARRTGSGGCGRSGDIVGDKRDPRAQQPAIAAPFDLRGNESVSARNRQRNESLTNLRRHGDPLRSLPAPARASATSLELQRDDVRSRAAVNSEQHARIGLSDLQHRHPQPLCGPLPRILPPRGTQGCRERRCGRARIAAAERTVPAGTRLRVSTTLRGLTRSSAIACSACRDARNPTNSASSGTSKSRWLCWPGASTSGQLSSGRPSRPSCSDIDASGNRAGCFGSLEIEHITAAGSRNRAFRTTRTGCRSVRCPGTRRHREQRRQFVGLRREKSHRSAAQSDARSDRTFRAAETSRAPRHRTRFAASGTMAALVVTTATNSTAHVIVAASAARPSDSVNRRASIHAAIPKALSHNSSRSEDARETPATYVGASRHRCHVGDIHWSSADDPSPSCKAGTRGLMTTSVNVTATLTSSSACAPAFAGEFGSRRAYSHAIGTARSGSNRNTGRPGIMDLLHHGSTIAGSAIKTSDAAAQRDREPAMRSRSRSMPARPRNPSSSTGAYATIPYSWSNNTPRLPAGTADERGGRQSADGIEHVRERRRQGAHVQHERCAQGDGDDAEQGCRLRSAHDWRVNTASLREERKKHPEHLADDDNPNQHSAGTCEQSQRWYPVGDPRQIGKHQQRESEERQQRVSCGFPETLGCCERARPCRLR